MVHDAQDFTGSPLIALQPYAVDPDGETVTFTALAPLPAGLVLNPDGTVTGVVGHSASTRGDPDHPGQYHIPIAISDGTTTSQVMLVIDASNLAPVNTVPIDNVALYPSQPFSFAAATAFADPDGDNLTFSATGLPQGVTIDPLTGIISGEPSPFAVAGGPAGDGVHVITVSVSDHEGGVASVTFTFKVKANEYSDAAPPIVLPNQPRDVPDEEDTRFKPIILGVSRDIDQFNPAYESGTYSIGRLVRDMYRQDEIDRHHHWANDSHREHYFGGSASVAMFDGGLLIGVRTNLWGDTLFIHLRDYTNGHAAGMRIIFPAQVEKIVSREANDIYALHWQAAPRQIRFEVEQSMQGGAVYRAAFVLDTATGEIRKDGDVRQTSVSREPFTDALRRHAARHDHQTKTLLAALGG